MTQTQIFTVGLLTKSKCHCLMKRMEKAEALALSEMQRGNPDAFRHIVEAHGRSLFRLAWRLTGNVEDAEEAVQEAFLRAYRHLERFDARSALGTWLYRITVNCARDVIRKRGKRPTPVELDDPAEVGELEGKTFLRPDREIHRSELQQAIEAALGHLSEEERQAFVLRHFEGSSIREICRLMTLSESAAKHAVFRAVHKMRNALEHLR